MENVPILFYLANKMTGFQDEGIEQGEVNTQKAKAGQGQQGVLRDSKVW